MIFYHLDFVFHHIDHIRIWCMLYMNRTLSTFAFVNSYLHIECLHHEMWSWGFINDILEL